MVARSLPRPRSRCTTTTTKRPSRHGYWRRNTGCCPPACAGFARAGWSSRAAGCALMGCRKAKNPLRSEFPRLSTRAASRHPDRSPEFTVATDISHSVLTSGSFHSRPTVAWHGAAHAPCTCAGVGAVACRARRPELLADDRPRNAGFHAADGDDHRNAGAACGRGEINGRPQASTHARGAGRGPAPVPMEAPPAATEATEVA